MPQPPIEADYSRRLLRECEKLVAATVECANFGASGFRLRLAPDLRFRQESCWPLPLTSAKVCRH